MMIGSLERASDGFSKYVFPRWPSLQMCIFRRWVITSELPPRFFANTRSLSYQAVPRRKNAHRTNSMSLFPFAGGNHAPERRR